MEHSHESTDPATANLNASTRVLLTTVAHKLLPALSTASASLENTNSNFNWTDTLSHYSTAAKQIDHIWQEVQPAGASDAGFDLTIVTTIDSGHPQPSNPLQQGSKANKQDPVFVGVNVPPLLSTMIGTEESECLYTADTAYSMHDEAEEEALLVQVREHNLAVGSVLDALELRLDQWRTDKDQQLAVLRQGGADENSQKGGNSTRSSIAPSPMV